MISIEKVLIALANHHRLSILKSIAENKGMIVNAATNILPISQSTTSHHLIKMRRANILNRVDNGRLHIYSINVKVLEEVMKYLENIIKECKKENHNEK